MDERSRVPLIVLAQQGQHPPPEPSDLAVVPMRFRLSTITENPNGQSLATLAVEAAIVRAQ